MTSYGSRNQFVCPAGLSKLIAEFLLDEVLKLGCMMLAKILFFGLLSSIAHGEMVCKEQGYTYRNNWCYRFDSKKSLTFDDALADCRSTGDDLVSIHDADTNQYIGSLHSDGVLIGLRYTDDQEKFIWTDSTEVDYTSLDDNFVDWKDYFGYCATNVAGTWRNAECEVSKYVFVCRQPAVDVTSNKKCPNETIIYMTPGTINSPGYPEKYDLRKETKYCTYKLAAKNGFQIKISFDEVNFDRNEGWFYIYKSWNDEYEYLQANNMFSGATVLLETNTVQIILFGSPSGRYKFTWSAEKPGNGTTANNVCPDADLAYINEGVVYSPGYPAYYDLKQEKRNCTYQLAAKTDGVVKIAFEELDLQGGWFQIYEGWSDQEDYIKVDSEIEGTSFIFKSNKVLLKLVSSSKGKWKFSWQSSEDDPSSTSNRFCPDPSIVYVDPGTILSPGYPALYDLNDEPRDCIYQLVVERGLRINITFSELKLVNNEGFLSVYEKQDQEVEKFQADNEFEGLNVIVESSDGIIKLRGSPAGRWRFTWKPVKVEVYPTPNNACPDMNRVYSLPVKILSPGYPGYALFSDNCDYRVASVNNTKVALHVDYMRDPTNRLCASVFRNFTSMRESVYSEFIYQSAENSTFIYASHHVGLRVIFYGEGVFEFSFEADGY